MAIVNPNMIDVYTSHFQVPTISVPIGRLCGETKDRLSGVRALLPNGDLIVIDMQPLRIHMGIQVGLCLLGAR